MSSEELLVSCGFLLCKGLVARLDLTSVCLGSAPQPQRLFSFLSLAWGFVADVDIESEKYRHVGAARFTVGTLVRLASLRVYQGKLAYLPAETKTQSAPVVDASTPECSPNSQVALSQTHPPSSSSSSSTPHDLCSALVCRSTRHSPGQNVTHNYCNSNNAFKAKRAGERDTTRSTPTSGPRGPPDSLLVPLDQPVPSDWTVVPEEDFVLVLAMYQSHLAEDLQAAPNSTLEDGLIHLFYIKAGISRATLLRLFLAMEKGAHVAANCPHLVYVKVRALRLEPYSAKGTITVDGELVDYGPVQAQVHRGLARLIAS